MRLVRLALARPYTILVAVFAIAIAAYFAVKRMNIDIFPPVGDPIVYLAQPYTGMDPQQFEGYISFFYEYHLMYIPRVKALRFRQIQGVMQTQLVFEPGTNMAEALSYVIAFANRARGLMPPSVQPPFIIRYDPGDAPIGLFVLKSKTKTIGELADLMLNNVRTLMPSIQGVTAAPPLGGNMRAIVLRLDPERMRAYRLSYEEVLKAANGGNQLVPAGEARIGDYKYMVRLNSIAGDKPGTSYQEVLKTAVRKGSGPTVYLRDIADVVDSNDYVMSYAHVDAKRTITMMVMKRYDTSTLGAVQNVKKAMSDLQAALPPDVELSFEWDQSVFVARAISNLFHEGVLAAILAGLMVLVFLRDWRSTLVVFVSIPSAIFGAIVALWATGQSLNLMTLGGLALAVSMLVDEAMVYIENVHAQLGAGHSRARAIAEAGRATGVPRLLAMLCVVAVFVPSVFMVGIGKQLFVPLSLAVAFAMMSSYILSSTLVPVLSAWLVREVHAETRGGFFAWIKDHYQSYLGQVLEARGLALLVYASLTATVLWVIPPMLGTEIFPQSDGKEIELLIRAPIGTRVERTEEIVKKVLALVKEEVGPEYVQAETDFTGMNPPNYPVNIVFMWTTGSHEAVMNIKFRDDIPIKGEALREKLRARFKKDLPEGTKVAFQAGDTVAKVMSFGTGFPVEVMVQGKKMDEVRMHAEKVRAELEKITELRDIQWAQPQDYPTLEVNIDRDRAGQFDLTTREIARSISMSTSSSRYQDINFWQDPKNGSGYQFQVEIPQYRISSKEDIESLPVMMNGESRPLVRDVADLKWSTMPGLIERLNGRRVISVWANISGATVGEIIPKVAAAVERAGTPPRGVVVGYRGEIPPLQQTIGGLQNGLLLAIGSIFLLLTGYFQSFRVAIAIMGTAPAVLVGVVIALFVTGTSLNVQSYMGAIMALGIAISNSILLLNFAEKARLDGASITEAVMTGAMGRLRPILMTAFAMLAGMMPMALGIGEGGSLSAPLGRAVVGGLLAATIATLTILPVLYGVFMRRASTASASMDPFDPRSRHYEPAAQES